jgi:hypothetical protein
MAATCFLRRCFRAPNPHCRKLLCNGSLGETEEGIYEISEGARILRQNDETDPPEIAQESCPSLEPEPLEVAPVLCSIHEAETVEATP